MTNKIRYWLFDTLLGQQAASFIWISVGQEEIPGRQQQEAVLLNPAKSCWILLNPEESCWILLNPAESCWILLNPAESCWILLNPAESCWILLNPPESCWILRSPAESSNQVSCYVSSVYLSSYSRQWIGILLLKVCFSRWGDLSFVRKTTKI